MAAPGVTKNVIIATNADGGLYHFHTTSGKQLNKISEEYKQLLTCDYKQDGLQFLTAGVECEIKLYDEQTRQEIHNFVQGANGEPGHNLRVFSAKFVKDDDNLLISGGWDKTVKIWDVRSGDVVRNICGPFICGDAIDMYDGFILTGSYSDTNQLQLWEFATGKFVEEIQFQTNQEKSSGNPACQIYSTQFQKTGGDLIVAGGAVANEAKIFNGGDYFQPAATITDLSRAVYTTDFNNAGDLVAIGGGDGVIRCFNIVGDMD